MTTLQEDVIDWYAINKRDLPWRNTSAWGVMVSEFMLQQTPVSRVLPKWNEWMSRWPTPNDLAEATPAEVITAWGRLGYPRRALRLYESAIEISGNYAGVVPSESIVLQSLPGVGEYTAAAIMAFAFGQPSLVLDINVRRVFSRVFDGEEVPQSHASTGEKSSRRELIPESNGELWAAATMELGALLCTAKNPKCGECPLSNICEWKNKGFPLSVQKKRTQDWHGTDRKCRGIIVQALRENDQLAEASLKALWDNDSQVEKALASLVRDGLISERGRAQYSLPQGSMK